MIGRAFRSGRALVSFLRLVALVFCASVVAGVVVGEARAQSSCVWTTQYGETVTGAAGGGLGVFCSGFAARVVELNGGPPVTANMISCTGDAASASYSFEFSYTGEPGSFLTYSGTATASEACGGQPEGGPLTLADLVSLSWQVAAVWAAVWAVMQLRKPLRWGEEPGPP